MEIDVKTIADILKKDNSASFGTFDIDGKPAIGVLFCLPEQIAEVQKFTEELIEKMKSRSKEND